MISLIAWYRRGSGGVLLPGVPHRYAADYAWRGSCWCGQPADTPVHHGTTGTGEAS